MLYYGSTPLAYAASHSLARGVQLMVAGSAYEFTLGLNGPSPPDALDTSSTNHDTLSETSNHVNVAKGKDAAASYHLQQLQHACPLSGFLPLHAAVVSGDVWMVDYLTRVGGEAR